jgi:hypothetical protein
MCAGYLLVRDEVGQEPDVEPDGQQGKPRDTAEP